MQPVLDRLRDESSNQLIIDKNRIPHMGTELMSIYPRDNRDLRQEYKIIDRTVRASSVTEEGCLRAFLAARRLVSFMSPSGTPQRFAIR